jgi:hypothetical protein
MATTAACCSGRTTLVAAPARVGARVVRSDRAGSSRGDGMRGIAAHGAVALRAVRAPTVGATRLRGRQHREPLRAVARMGHMTTSREPSPARKQLRDPSTTVNVLGLGQAMVRTTHSHSDALSRPQPAQLGAAATPFPPKIA